MKVIFILGSGHCGSTVMDLILDTHSKIAGTGEIHVMEKGMMCTCGKKMDDCSFWQKAVPVELPNRMEVFRGKIGTLLGHKIFYDAHTRKPIDNTKFVKQNEEIFENISKNTNSTVIVDSSKNADRVAALMSVPSKINPVIVHLVRDGRPVSWVYLKKYEKPVTQLFKWFLANVKIELLKRQFPNIPSIFVKYEDFVVNPEKVLGDILGKVDLEYEEGMIDFKKAEHHQIGGNNMRFREGGFVRKVDESWKSDMPLIYRVSFNLLFGWLNFFYQNR